MSKRSGADLYLDLFRLCLFGLRHRDGEHAITVGGPDAICLDLAGELERASEGAVDPLDAVRGTRLRLGVLPPLAANRQTTVAYGDVQIVSIDTGQIGGDDVLVAALGDIDRRSEGR